MINETIVLEVTQLAKAYAPLVGFGWPIAWAAGIYLLMVGSVIMVFILSLKEIILKLLDKLLAEGIFGRNKEATKTK